MNLSPINFRNDESSLRLWGRLVMACAVIAVSTVAFGLAQIAPLQAASHGDQPIEVASLTQLLTGTIKTQSGLSLGVGIPIVASNSDGQSSTTTDANGNFSMWVPAGTVNVKPQCAGGFLWRDASGGDNTSIQLPGYPCTYGDIDASVPWDSTQGPLALKLPDVHRVRVHVSSGGVAVAGASVSSGSRLRSTTFELSAASGSRAAVNATIPYVPTYAGGGEKITDVNGDAFINVWESSATFQLGASKVDHGVNLNVSTYGFSTTDSLVNLELPPPPVELTGTIKTQSGLSLGVGIPIVASNSDGQSSTTTDANGNFSMWVPAGTVNVKPQCAGGFLWRDASGGDNTSIQLPGYPCTYGDIDASVPWDSTQGPLALKLPDVHRVRVHVSSGGVAVAGASVSSGSRLRSTTFELSAASGSRAAVNATIPYVPTYAGGGEKITDVNGDVALNVWGTNGQTFSVSASGQFNGVTLNGSMSNVPADGFDHSIAFTVPGNISYDDRNASAPFLTDLTLLEAVGVQSLQSVFTLGQSTKREIFSMSDDELAERMSTQTAPTIGYSPPFSQTATYYKTPTLNQYRTSLSVNAASTLNGATIRTYGLDNLHVGKNFATVQVTDPANGAARSYTIAVYVPPVPTPQETLTVTSVNGTIGSPLTLTTSGGSGTGLVTYAVTNGTATGCVESGGVLTVASLGTCLVVATKASDSTFAEASSISTAVTFGDIIAPALYTGGFTFAVADGNATVTGLTSGGSGCEGKYLVVPSDDGAGHPVTAIGFKAFQRYSTNCHLTGVSIPPTMTLIGSEAFAWNQTMTEINIPTSVTVMENYAFTGAAENVATKIYFEGDRPTIRSNVFASAQSGRIFYNVGQTGWPGSTIDSYAPEVSARVAQATLSITSSTSGTVGTPLTLTSSGGSGWGGLVYLLDGNDCLLSGDVLSRLTTGSCMVRVSKSPTAIYARANSSSVEVNFAAALLPQETLTLTSNQTSPIGTPITMATSGGSGTGLIRYQVYDGTATGCAESDGMLTSTTTGTCEVTATKAADSTYSEQISIRKQFVFHLWDQQALVLTSTTGVVGTPLTLTYSGGSGNGAVSYQMYYYSGTASDCVVANGTVSASSAGTCLVQLTKSSSGNYDASSMTETVTFTVAQTTTTTEPSTTTTTEPSTTTTQPSNTSTTTTMVPPPAESVVVALPRAETPLVADNSLSVGAELTVTISGFAPGEFVQLIIASTPQVIGSGYANAQGVVTLSGKIPTDLASGNHTLAVYAPESGTGFNQPITVAGLVLPATGWSGAGLLYGWAMLMILLGVIWHFIGRRRVHA